VLPRDGFFVEEICQAGFTSYFGFPVYEPRTFVTCGHQGTLGFGFPTALGVKVGNPDKAVVSITGDGGFMFGVQDLATAVRYGINVVIVLFNNDAYGNVLRDQQNLFEGRLIGSELRNPDFVKLAESFGVAASRVSTPDGLKRELERALALDAPALIEVSIERGSEVSPWPFLMPAPARAKGSPVSPD
jgi:acetolactate synthase-1/2/3 large subunit